MPNLPFRTPPVVEQKARIAPARPRRRPESLGDVLVGRLRRAPWFLISAFVHLCALAILAPLAVRHVLPEEEAFSGAFVVGLYGEEPAPTEVPKPPEPEKPKVQEPPPEPKPFTAPEEPKPAPPPVAPPSPAPESETTTVKAERVMEVAGGNAPSRGLFASRAPAAREAALRQWGGSPASEQAVDAGLGWLAHHQERDAGCWNDGDPQLKFAPGLTGLALLAFLGKGHTHTDEGPYRETVARGLRYLVSIQSSDGRFGEPFLLNGEKNNRYLMYHQALATMALAEAHAITRDPKVEDAVRRGVAFIQRAQQDGGGWDYSDLPTGRCDTSVTGWQLMALKSAHAAGFEINWNTLFGVMRHLDLYTSSSGEVAYANKEPGTWRRGPGMVAVGLFCYQMLGWPRDNGLLVRQADYILRNPPDWTKATTTDRDDVSVALHTMYYWYYGTLALFNMGGHWWREWNGQLRELLIAHQRREGERRGSWDPPARGLDAAGGRVYVTALNILNLEIYYRYLPFYRCGAFDAVDILENAAKARGMASTRCRALRLLGAFPTGRAQDLLFAALDDPDSATRATAQRALVEQRCARVVPKLAEQLQSDNTLARMQAVTSLAGFGDKRLAPHLIKALRDPERVVRDRAAAALRKLTGEGFGFRADADPEAREQALADWERWWKAENAQPPPEGIRGSVLVVDDETPDSIVLDAGSEKAVRRGTRFEIRREGKVIAVVQAEKVEPTLTVARIIERRGDPVREGDAIQSLPEPAVTRSDDEKEE